MSIESTLERIATALEALAGKSTSPAPAPEQPTETAPTKRGPGRPPKAVAAPAAEPAPVVEVPVVASTPSAPPAGATKEQTQNALVALIKANKRDTVVKILGEHGAQSVSALAPEHYAAVHAKALAATPTA